MDNIKFIYLIVVLLCFSCSQNPSNSIDELHFEISEEIEHHKLNLDTAVICGFVVDMEISDSLLIVHDFIMQKNAINIYNYRTGEVLYQLEIGRAHV